MKSSTLFSLGNEKGKGNAERKEDKAGTESREKTGKDKGVDGS